MANAATLRPENSGWFSLLQRFASGRSGKATARQLIAAESLSPILRKVHGQVNKLKICLYPLYLVITLF
jgi:hypothetical protein